MQITSVSQIFLTKNYISLVRYSKREPNIIRKKNSKRTIVQQLKSEVMFSFYFKEHLNYVHRTTYAILLAFVIVQHSFNIACFRYFYV